MTDDLVAFIRARLDEDEQTALSTPGPAWEHRQVRGDHDESVVFENYVAVADPERNTVVLSDVDAEALPFVLRQDPARVLAEVDAKRRIVGEYEANSVDEWPLFPLLCLALPYASHPDYRPEWAPDA